MNFSA